MLQTRRLVLFAVVLLSATALFVAGPGGPLPARAASIWYVSAATGSNSNNCTSAGSPCKTITHAISLAGAGDTIQVAAGSYNTALGESFPLTVSIPLTLAGAGARPPEAGGTTVDATGANQSVFVMNNGSGTTVAVSGMTITGGNPTTTGVGGGIDNHNVGTLSLTNVLLSGNSAIDGGGICYCAFGNLTGTLTLTNVTISDNTASGLGGGIYSASGTMTLTNVTISGNSAASDGGGIDNEGSMALTNVTISGNSTPGQGGGIENNGPATLTNVTISGNTTTTNLGGGGIDNGGSTTMTLTNVTLSDNSAGFGGGIANRGPLTLANVTLSGNSATVSDGGGIFTSSNSPATLTNVTITGNTAPKEGGGIENDGYATLTNVTISGNSATVSVGGIYKGGGIYNQGATTLQGTILAGNIPGGDCYQFAATITSDGYNIADDATCGLSGTGDLNSNTSLNLGALANNGGPAQTVALQAGSSAIDHIPTSAALCNAVSPPYTPFTDQRGVPRPQGAGCDSGAFEYTGVVDSTSTAVSCAPSSVTVNSSTTCTATVTDTNTAAASTPDGAVAFHSSGSGNFSNSGGCALGGSGVSASCQLSYTPAAGGAQTISATYSTTDSAHSGSSCSGSGCASLNVTAYKLGDVNGDGFVTSVDALCVLRMVVGLPGTTACPIPPPGDPIIANGETQGGAPTAVDALCILRGVAGLPATNTCPLITAPVSSPAGLSP